MTARFRQDWVNALLDVADAIDELGPIRCTFSIDHGFILDGRYGVRPAELFDALNEKRARPSVVPIRRDSR